MVVKDIKGALKDNYKGVEGWPEHIRVKSLHLQGAAVASIHRAAERR